MRLFIMTSHWKTYFISYSTANDVRLYFSFSESASSVRKYMCNKAKTYHVHYYTNRLYRNQYCLRHTTCVLWVVWGVDLSFAHFGVMILKQIIALLLKCSDILTSHWHSLRIYYWNIYKYERKIGIMYSRMWR